MNTADGAYRSVLQVTQYPTPQQRIAYFYRLLSQYTAQLETALNNNSWFRELDFVWMDRLWEDDLEELIFELRFRKISQIVDAIMCPIDRNCDDLEQTIQEYEKMIETMRRLVQYPFTSDIIRYAEKILTERKSAKKNRTAAIERPLEVKRRGSWIDVSYVFQYITPREKLIELSPFIIGALEWIWDKRYIRPVYSQLSTKINGTEIQSRIKAKLGNNYTIPTNFDANSERWFVGYYWFTLEDRTELAARRLLSEVFWVDFNSVPSKWAIDLLADVTRIKAVSNLNWKIPTQQKQLNDFIFFRDQYLLDRCSDKFIAWEIKSVSVDLGNIMDWWKVRINGALKQSLLRIGENSSEIFEDIVVAYNKERV